jgi:hypothetical protein
VGIEDRVDVGQRREHPDEATEPATRERRHLADQLGVLRRVVGGQRLDDDGVQPPTGRRRAPHQRAGALVTREVDLLDGHRIGHRGIDRATDEAEQATARPRDLPPHLDGVGRR